MDKQLKLGFCGIAILPTREPERSSAPYWIAQEKAPRSVTPLMTLPPELHLEMISYLQYKVQWALKRTNKHFSSFKELVAPSDFFNMKHLGTNFQMGLYMSLILARMIDRQMEPCYTCRKFKSKEWFEAREWGKSMWWTEGNMCLEFERVKSYTDKAQETKTQRNALSVV